MKNWELGNKNKGSGKIKYERASKKKDGGSPSIYVLSIKAFSKYRIQQFSEK
jgi:hypothetical protein